MELVYLMRERKVNRKSKYRVISAVIRMVWGLPLWLCLQYRRHRFNR